MLVRHLLLFAPAASTFVSEQSVEENSTCTGVTMTKDRAQLPEFPLFDLLVAVLQNFPETTLARALRALVRVLSK